MVQKLEVSPPKFSEASRNSHANQSIQVVTKSKRVVGSFSPARDSKKVLKIVSHKNWLAKEIFLILDERLETTLNTINTATKLPNKLLNKSKKLLHLSGALKHKISKAIVVTLKKISNYEALQKKCFPLKVVSATFLLVCFVCLKESTCKTRENAFYFTSKALVVLEIINF